MKSSGLALYNTSPKSINFQSGNGLALSAVLKKINFFIFLNNQYIAKLLIFYMLNPINQKRAQ